MKRITAAIIASLLLIAFVACADDGDSSFDTSYPTRTAAFYGNMDTDSFWFTMEFINNGTVCTFTQATDGSVVTTIEDFANDAYDKYHIYDKTRVHKLNVNTKSFDTLIGPHGQAFLFEDYTPDMFTNPSSTGLKTFDGVKYYCESFNTTATSGKGSGTNNYYFEDYKLKVVEIVENGNAVMIMKFNDYSNTIPDSVYLSVPSDFKAGTLEFEGSDISYNESWNMWG